MVAARVIVQVIGIKMKKEDLISEAYCQMNADIYNSSKRSAGGAKHAEIVREIALKWNSQMILDYGCGQGEFKKAFDALKTGILVCEYDPAIEGKQNIFDDSSANLYDLITCTDVLEHIEPEKIDNVLKHIFYLMGKGGYFIISLCETKVFLPDGRNAHILLKPVEWWLEKFMHQPCEINHCSIRIKKNKIIDMILWVSKK
jgi:2-polyprenyl-3-methyl-5-hydroxy-6-metoxy-1,4-benzoquinol methylase